MHAVARRVLPLITASLVLATVAIGAPATAAAPTSRRAPAANGAYIVLFRPGADPSATTSKLRREKGVKAKRTYAKAVRGLSADLTATQVNELRSDSDVALVAPDLPVRATADTPVASGDNVPTGVRRIAAGTSTTARQASTATVAVVDTGVDLSNPDLNVSAGTNCVGTGLPNDDDGHGTHVAGTIGAKNNGTGVVGVAPGTHLDAVKVLDANGNGTYSQIICGLDWVTATRTDSDPSNDVSVVNMSLGGVGDPVSSCATTTDALHKAICSATAAGVTIVVAAGNSGYDYDYAASPDTPAVYPEVLTVTAAGDSDGQPGGTGGSPACWSTQPDDQVASFSNFATTAAASAHTIAAPGVCITSDAPGGGTAVMSGTSMATPHMTGAVALCLGEGGVAGPCAGLTPAQIIAKVRSDAAAHTTSVPAYGFTGDPAHAISGRYYGYLQWSGTPATVTSPPPTATAVSPTDNRSAVPLTDPVTVTFDQPMNQASVQSAFSLVRTTTGTTVAGTFSWNGNTMTFKPTSALVAGAVYKATVGTGARSASGTALGSVRTWSFRGVYTAHLTPASVTVTSGTFRSGSPSSLVGDDSAYYVVGSTTTGPAAGFYGSVSADNDIASLAFAYAGKNSATASQVLSFWNWTTSRWVTVDTRSVGTSVLTVRGDAAGTLADYVSGTSGTGSIRFQVRSTRSSAFTTSGGRMALQYTR